MSKKWKIICIIAVVVGVAAAIVVFRLRGIDSFLENVVAGISVSALTFAVVAKTEKAQTVKNRVFRVVRNLGMKNITVKRVGNTVYFYKETEKRD